MRILCIDCEGPITINDNAFEICQHFLPQGEHFFTLLSGYDDYLADVIKREGYVAGNTLKLITPFLKAYGLTNKRIRDYCRKSIRFVPGAEKMLDKLKSLMEVFVVSTSYTPYIDALCELVNFPRENTFSTSLDLDRYFISPEEKKKLIRFYREILQLSLTPPKKEESGKISPRDRETLQRLDTIFFQKLPFMDSRFIMEQVNPVGGEEKVKALKKSINQTGGKPEDTIYLGDSITDAKALRWIREKGGVSVAFNANLYALREAEFACISSHTYPLFLIIKEFKRRGKEGVVKMASTWPQRLSEEEKEKLNSLARQSVFAQVRENNLSYLVRISEKMRKKVRGEKIGELG